MMYNEDIFVLYILEKKFKNQTNSLLSQFNLDGTSLVIHELTGKDDGEYTCELETKVLVISLAQFLMIMVKALEFG